MTVKSVGPALNKTAIARSTSDPWQISTDDFPADGTPAEQLWFALQYAVLAPSTHNTQPWHFNIQSRDVDLLADFSRRLPVADPEGRELIMSCGAALFHLRLALAYFGIATNIRLYPDSSRIDWLARIGLGGRMDVEAEIIPLFQAITHRRTNRHPFRDEPVSADLLSELQTAAQLEGAWLRIVDNDEDRAQLARLVAEGDRQQWADKHFRQELANWVRPIGNTSHDGLPVATQDLGALLAHAGPFVIRTFDLGKGHAANDQEIALHSPALAILGTAGDDPAAWLAAGQALGRVLLRAQSDDLSASFLNQCIEVTKLREEVAQLTGLGGAPQIVLRLGHGDRVPHTRRRSLGEVVSLHEPRALEP